MMGKSAEKTLTLPSITFRTLFVRLRHLID
jgi:hypothetical protein